MLRHHLAIWGRPSLTPADSTSDHQFQSRYKPKSVYQPPRVQPITVEDQKQATPAKPTSVPQQFKRSKVGQLPTEQQKRKFFITEYVQIHLQPFELREVELQCKKIGPVLVAVQKYRQNQLSFTIDSSFAVEQRQGRKSAEKHFAANQSQQLLQETPQMQPTASRLEEPALFKSKAKQPSTSQVMPQEADPSAIRQFGTLGQQARLQPQMQIGKPANPTQIIQPPQQIKHQPVPFIKPAPLVSDNKSQASKPMSSNPFMISMDSTFNLNSSQLLRQIMQPNQSGPLVFQTGAHMLPTPSFIQQAPVQQDRIFMAPVQNSLFSPQPLQQQGTTSPGNFFNFQWESGTHLQRFPNNPLSQPQRQFSLLEKQEPKPKKQWTSKRATTQKIRINC